MLHKMGYVGHCAGCGQPIKEKECSSIFAELCVTCEVKQPPEDQTAARLRWEETGIQS